MSEIKVFENELFGNVRTVEDDGKVLFCGADIATALKYQNTRKAITDHCKGVTKRYTPTNGGTQEMSFITEGDVYRLIAHSQMPTAAQFERWVFDEVIPDIRKHGLYANYETIEKLLNNPDTMIQTLTAYKEEKAKRLALEAQAAKDMPKVLFADSVAASSQSILVGQLAKLIRQNGVEIGQNRLFAELRKDGYLCGNGSSYNLPTQRAMELGLFEIKERSVCQPDGSILLTRTTLVSGKGQVYFINRYLKQLRAEA